MQKKENEATLENETGTPRKKSFIEGSLEVKLPTIWTDEKQSRDEQSRGREKGKD